MSHQTVQPVYGPKGAHHPWPLGLTCLHSGAQSLNGTDQICYCLLHQEDCLAFVDIKDACLRVPIFSVHQHFEICRPLYYWFGFSIWPIFGTLYVHQVAGSDVGHVVLSWHHHCEILKPPLHRHLPAYKGFQKRSLNSCGWNDRCLWTIEGTQQNNAVRKGCISGHMYLQTQLEWTPHHLSIWGWSWTHLRPECSFPRSG